MSETLRSEIHRHIAVMRRYAVALTGDPVQADDVVQEALVCAIKGASGFRPDAALLPWLLRIVHNVHVSERRRRRVETVPLDDCAATLGVGGGAELRLEGARVLQALLHLPEDQRAAVTLVCLDELSYAEAAEVLGIPKGTLMSRLARGRAALRALVDREKPAQAFRIVGGSER